jgi:hypothetical protein
VAIRGQKSSVAPDNTRDIRGITERSFLDQGQVYSYVERWALAKDCRGMVEGFAASDDGRTRDDSFGVRQVNTAIDVLVQRQVIRVHDQEAAETLPQ